MDASITALEKNNGTRLIQATPIKRKREDTLADSKTCSKILIIVRPTLI